MPDEEPSRKPRALDLNRILGELHEMPADLCECPRNAIPKIRAIAERYGFTYQEAFEYVLHLGIIHAHYGGDPGQ